MLELSASLARVLEFLTRALPAAFLPDNGPPARHVSAGLHLARLAEVAAFVVAHLAGACSGAAPNTAAASHGAALPPAGGPLPTVPPVARALAAHFPPAQNMRRATLIAPVIGAPEP